MSLESGTYISDLVDSNPTGSDPVSQGDDHIRLIKSVLKNSFPGISGAVSATDEQLTNAVAGPAFNVVLSNDQGTAGVAYEKINLDLETFDTNNCFSNGRFTPNVPGVYVISFNVFANSSGLTNVGAELRKNNSTVLIALESGNGTELIASGSACVLMNGTTDYLELWGYAGGGVGILFASEYTQMSGGMLRSV